MTAGEPPSSQSSFPDELPNPAELLEEEEEEVVVVVVVVVDPLDPVPLLPLPPPPEPPPKPPLGVAQILKPVSVFEPSERQVTALPGAPGPKRVVAPPDRLPQYFVPSEVCK